METSGDVCVTYGQAVRLAPEQFPPDLPTTPLLDGAPQWYSFEHQAWAMGEDIRQALAARPKLRSDAQVQHCLLKVIATANLRRGRQAS